MRQSDNVWRGHFVYTRCWSHLLLIAQLIVLQALISQNTSTCSCRCCLSVSFLKFLFFSLLHFVLDIGIDLPFSVVDKK